MRKVAATAFNHAVAPVKVLQRFNSLAEIGEGVLDKFPAGYSTRIVLDLVPGDVHRCEYHQPGVKGYHELAFYAFRVG